MKEGEKCKKGPDPWAPTHLVSLRASGSSRALAQKRSALEGVWGSLRWPTPSHGEQAVPRCTVHSGILHRPCFCNLPKELLS